MNERGKWTSASSAEADSLCPGRHLLQQKCQESGPTKDADFGTRVHEAWASGNDEGLTTDEHAVLERVIDIEGSLVARYFGQAVTTGSGVKRVREKRLWIQFGEIAHSGQPDVIWRNETKALILEGKMLWGDHAESPRNQQLRDQVCLYYANSLLLTEIACAVIQPRISMSPEVCVYSVDDIAKATALLSLRVSRNNDPNAPRLPGVVQCKFCRARNICPEYSEWAARTVVSGSSIVGVPVANWTPEQRVVFCESRSIAQRWLDECEAEMKRLLALDPNAVPGWKLKDGVVREIINDPQELFARFNRMGGTLAQFMQCVSIAKGKLAEQVRAATGDKGKALDKTVEKLTEGIVDVKQNAPSLSKIKS